MNLLKKAPAILPMAMAAMLGVGMFGAQAQGVVVKSKNNHPGATASVKYPSATYTLTCWQEGKEILSNAGTGRISLGNDFVSRSVSIALEDNAGANVTLFSTDNAFCRLQTQDSKRR